MRNVTNRYKNGASFEARDVITRTSDAAERVKTATDAILDKAIAHAAARKIDEAVNDLNA